MIGLATVVTVDSEKIKSHYRTCLEVFLYSLKKNSNLKELTRLHIFHNGLSDLDKENFEKIKHPNLILKYYLVDNEIYLRNKKDNPKYWSFEAFKLDYEKVIFFDSDLLCLDDINELFNIDYDLGMVHEKNRGCFNAGLIIIGKKYLNIETYNDLLACSGDDKIFGNDQKIYNTYFRDIQEVNRKWNTLVTEAENLSDVKLLHYIHKPYIQFGRDHINNIYSDLWFDYYFEMEHKCLF